MIAKIVGDDEEDVGPIRGWGGKGRPPKKNTDGKYREDASKVEEHGNEWVGLKRPAPLE